MASDPLRPSLSEEEGNEKIVLMVRACWDESPEKKPTFSSIKKILREASSKGWVGCATFSPNHLTIRILKLYGCDGSCVAHSIHSFILPLIH